MDPLIIGFIGLLGLMILVGIGVHVGIALGVVGLVGIAMIVGPERAVTMATTSIYFANASYALITLPLFILMGLLGASGGMNKTLYNNTSLWAGRIKGSLGIATIMGCTAFGSICGSSFVTAAIFAQVSAPEMRRHGYDKKLAYGLCASAGIIGMMIPPSILAVVYGILSGLSVGKLLLAGIGPGLLLTVLFSGLVIYYAYRRKDLIKPQEIKTVSLVKKLKTLPSFWPVIVTAVIIFGGIFGGIFSPTEAAAVSTVVIIFLLVITCGKKTFKLLVIGLRDTAITSAMIFLTMAGALVFSRFLVLSGLSQQLISLIVDANFNNFVLLLILSGMFLVLGTIMDSTSMLTISIPIVTPIISGLKIDPYYFAILAIYASQIGIITPPFGLSVFTVKAVAEPDVSIEEIFRGSFPFLILLLFCMVLLLLFPQIITFII